MRISNQLFTFLALPLAACAVEVDPVAVAVVDQEIANGPFTTQPRWTVQIDGCTASVLNERWLLTAEHCLTDKPLYGAINIYYASAAGVRTLLWSGQIQRIGHPEHDGHGDADHDVGLVYLRSHGLDLDGIGKAALHFAPTGPWKDGDEPDELAIVGWGATGGDCETSDPKLRIADNLDVDYNPNNDRFASAAIEDTHACGGDSGAPYLLWRGPAGDDGYIQFAVHSGRRTMLLPFAPFPTTRHQGALIEDNIGWISDVIANSATLFNSLWVYSAYGGYQFKQSEIYDTSYSDLRGHLSMCMGAGTGGAAALRTCNGTASQTWKFNLAGQVVRPPDDLLLRRTCLEAATPINGGAVRIVNCNATSMAQRFGYTATKDLRSALDWTKCVVPTAGTDGAALQIQACNGTQEQKWYP